MGSNLARAKAYDTVSADFRNPLPLSNDYDYLLSEPLNYGKLFQFSSQKFSKIAKKIREDISKYSSLEDFKKLEAIIETMKLKSHGGAIEFQVRNAGSKENMLLWFDRLITLFANIIIIWRQDTTSSNNIISIHPTLQKMEWIKNQIILYSEYYKDAMKLAILHNNSKNYALKTILSPSQQIMAAFMKEIIHFIFTGNFRKYRKLFISSNFKKYLNEYNRLIWDNELFDFPRYLQNSLLFPTFFGHNWIKEYTSQNPEKSEENIQNIAKYLHPIIIEKRILFNDLIIEITNDMKENNDLYFNKIENIRYFSDKQKEFKESLKNNSNSNSNSNNISSSTSFLLDFEIPDIDSNTDLIECLNLKNNNTKKQLQLDSNLSSKHVQFLNTFEYVANAMFKGNNCHREEFLNHGTQIINQYFGLPSIKVIWKNIIKADLIESTLFKYKDHEVGCINIKNRKIDLIIGLFIFKNNIYFF